MGAVVMANKKNFFPRGPWLWREEVKPFLLDIGDICKNRKLTSCNAIARKLRSMEKYKGISLRTMNRHVKRAIELTIEEHINDLHRRTQRDADPIRRIPPPEMTEALRKWALERCRRFAQYEKVRELFFNGKLSFKEWDEQRELLRQSGEWEIFN
jgi:hypothetical protein